jgi:hypothetical protein
MQKLSKNKLDAHVLNSKIEIPCKWPGKIDPAMHKLAVVAPQNPLGTAS